MSDEQDVSTIVDEVLAENYGVSTPEGTDAEPSNEDNNADDTKEPETTSNTTETDNKQTADDKSQTKDGEQDLSIPDKFKTKDGQLNTSALLKSYKELEPLLNERANWAKEKANLEELNRQAQQREQELAKAYGFESMKALNEYQQQVQDVREIAGVKANEFYKYLNYSSDPQQAQTLLYSYAQNPNDATFEEIARLFPAQVTMQVGQVAQQAQTYLSQQKQQREQQAQYNSANDYLQNVVPKYKERFEDSDFKELFSNAFNIFGPNTDIDYLAKFLDGVKEKAVSAYKEGLSKDKENQAAINDIKTLAPGSKGSSGYNFNRNVNEMTSGDIDEAVTAYLDEIYR